VSYKEHSDQDLVRLCLKTDEQAARELVERFERPVFSLVYRMVRDRELAEDLTQEVFVRTFNNLQRYDRSYKFSSWLFKIAYNLTVDHLRKKQVKTISMHGSPDAVTPDRQEATSLTLESDEESPDALVEARELAEDLTQEVFVRTFNNLQRYDRSYKFSSWLFKIAYNLTVDYLRKKQVKTISMHGSPDAVTPERQEATSLSLESDEESPDAMVEARELAGYLEDAIAQLRPEYRTAILLRHVEGRPYEEISDIMGVPLGTVKTYIFRARRELRDLLEDRWDDGDEE